MLLCLPQKIFLSTAHNLLACAIYNLKQNLKYMKKNLFLELLFPTAIFHEKDMIQYSTTKELNTKRDRHEQSRRRKNDTKHTL